MKIVAVSDLHGNLPDIPECDLLLLAGDLCPVKDHSLTFQAAWLDTTFREWLADIRAKQIVGVAGNHDFVFQELAEAVPKDLPWTYLQDRSLEWNGLNIYGTPWQKWFGGWAFNVAPDDLAAKWSLIPKDTDILVCHGPPFGHGDGVPMGDEVRLEGCPFLLARIQEIEPRLVVFGHIHEGRGVWTLGNTTLANVTYLDVRYQPVYQPWVYEL